jgi:hypothetical protein
LNQNLVNRRSMVSKVARECLDEIRKEQNITAARAKYNTRKINVLGQGKSGSRPAVALSRGYFNERISWESSGKTIAFSAGESA